MKESNIAPLFACMYHGLAETARKHGYALAIHGSVITDMDLVAIPWVEDCAEPEVVMQAIKDHVHALSFREMLRNDLPNISDEQVEEEAVRCKEQSPERKPHGRLSWNLYLRHGVKIDLSVVWPYEYPCPAEEAAV